MSAEPHGDPVVRPGTPSFRCLADQCGAMCCRNPYRVDLGEAEIARLAGAVNAADLIDERGAMLLLRQVDDACALLTGDLRCRAYNARPNGCRSYPFRLAPDAGGRTQVVRDLACPGFVGPPLTESEYDALRRSLREGFGALIPPFRDTAPTRRIQSGAGSWKKMDAAQVDGNAGAAHVHW